MDPILVNIKEIKASHHNTISFNDRYDENKKILIMNITMYIKKDNVFFSGRYLVGRCVFFKL